MPTEAFSNQANDPSQLLFAVCHEISNLVAAIRLQAHLLDPNNIYNIIQSLFVISLGYHTQFY